MRGGGGRQNYVGEGVGHGVKEGCVRARSGEKVKGEVVESTPGVSLQTPDEKEPLSETVPQIRSTRGTRPMSDAVVCLLSVFACQVRSDLFLFLFCRRGVVEHHPSTEPTTIFFFCLFFLFLELLFKFSCPPIFETAACPSTPSIF